MMDGASKSQLRKDVLAGLKQGVLLAAGVLVLTLPPAGLATLRSPGTAGFGAGVTPAAHVSLASSARQGPFRPADFDSHAASAEARFIADWAADSGDSQGLPYLVLDKRDARLFVFAADGKLIDTSPVLLGAAPGDDSVEGIGTKPMSQVRQDEKTTPAGRFVAKAGRNASGEEVVWVDYDASVSMHRVRLVDPKEQRLQRLASSNPADRRISYGCINLPVAFFESSIWPLLRSTHAVVYVLPETRALDEIFASAYDASTKHAQAQHERHRPVKISRQ